MGQDFLFWEDTGVEVQRYKGAKKENQEMRKKLIMYAIDVIDSGQGYLGCWVILHLITTAGAEQSTTPSCSGYIMTVKTVSVVRRSRMGAGWGASPGCQASTWTDGLSILVTSCWCLFPA